MLYYNICLFRLYHLRIIMVINSHIMSLYIHICMCRCVNYVCITLNMPLCVPVCDDRYVHQLYILVNCFLRPLRMAASSKKPPISHDDVSSIFLNRWLVARRAVTKSGKRTKTHQQFCLFLLSARPSCFSIRSSTRA